MFTGIIHSVLPINMIKKNPNFHTHIVQFPQFLLKKLIVGSSISYNGCCLTVSKIQKNFVSFDIIEETLHVTNIQTLKIGDLVNIERSAHFNSEIGGHLMFGHIICTAKIKKILSSCDTQRMYFEIDNNKKNIMKYIFYKGSIGIDGISLTISNIINNSFYIHLIPHTLKHTTLKNKKIGDIVNVEIDMQTKIIVDTVEKRLYKYDKTQKI